MTKKKHELKFIHKDKLRILKRNPQYLTPKQMEALKKSILRDGFLVPILVRPLKNEVYEIVSGNHRFMAAVEIGMQEIPCIIAKLSDDDMKRIAVNLNTVHGMPNAELLAPFLADINDLSDIYINEELLDDLKKFDVELADMIEKQNIPKNIDYISPLTNIKQCECPVCGNVHISKK